MDANNDERTDSLKPQTARLVFLGEIHFLGPNFLVMHEEEQFMEGKPSFETLEGTLPVECAKLIAAQMHGSRVAVSIERLRDEPEKDEFK